MLWAATKSGKSLQNASAALWKGDLAREVVLELAKKDGASLLCTSNSGTALKFWVRAACLKIAPAARASKLQEEPQAMCLLLGLYDREPKGMNACAF